MNSFTDVPRKIIAVSGSGAIGVDPMDRATWSGSSFHFFSECDRRQLLRKAIGVEAHILLKSWLAIWSYSRDPMVWRRKLYMGVRYRETLTRCLQPRLRDVNENDTVIQLGSMFDSSKVLQGRCPCWSYNDGNFLMASRSPHFPPGIPAKKIDATLRYEREVVHGLTKILTMSEYLRNSFITGYDCPPEKVACIGCGINLDVLPTDPEEKDYQQPNILFIGVDFNRKGGEDVIKAFREVKSAIPDAILHVVGPQKECNKCTSSPGVQWHGFLDKSNPQQSAVLEELFRNATLFVMPSRYEPFGIAPLEAMSYRVPCIVSNAWALPEIVTEGKCGELVEPQNSEELAAKIISLLKSPDRLQRYGEAGRRRVESTFTWKAVVDRFEALLHATE